MTSAPAPETMQPKVYVVSMLRSAERRKAISTQLSRLGVQFTFIDAVDASSVASEWLWAQVDEHAMWRNLGRRLSGPEIGCALSHRIAYKDIIESGRSGGLILEDDVNLSPVFLEALAWFRAQSDALAETCVVYHLGALSRPYARVLILNHRKVQRISDRLRFAKPPIWQPTEVLGTCGYFVTRAAARSLLVAPRVETLADLWFVWARRTGGRLFVSVPAVVIHPQDPESSEIRASRSEVMGERKLMKYRTHRFLRYLYYGIRRRILQFVVKPVVEAVLK